jgi:hypothetical protein
MITLFVIVLALFFAFGLEWQTGVAVLFIGAFFSIPADYEIYKQHKENRAPIYPANHVQNWGGRRSPETLARVRQSRKDKIEKQEKEKLERVVLVVQTLKQVKVELERQEVELERQDVERKGIELAELQKQWENK